MSQESELGGSQHVCEPSLVIEAVHAAAKLVGPVDAPLPYACRDPIATERAVDDVSLSIAILGRAAQPCARAPHVYPWRIGAVRDDDAPGAFVERECGHDRLYGSLANPSLAVTSVFHLYREDLVALAGDDVSAVVTLTADVPALESRPLVERLNQLFELAP